MFPSRAMARHSTWCSTLIVVASAMQKKQEQTWVRPEQTHVSTKNDWDFLHNAFHTDLVLQLESCNSSEYDEFLEREEIKGLPKFKLSSMEIPSNQRILFYGHSYLHQVLSNILVANDKTLMKNGPFGGYEGESRHTDGSGFQTSWDFSVNTRITEIQNYEKLQRIEYIDELKDYMKEHKFDMAFFMNPHPDCYWLQNQDDPTACDHHRIPDYAGDRSDANPFWDVIKEAVGDKVYEVEAWDWPERKQWHADESRRVNTHEILTGHACNQDGGCTSQDFAIGHQCQPGKLLTVSDLVVQKMHGL